MKQTTEKGNSYRIVQTNSDTRGYAVMVGVLCSFGIIKGLAGAGFGLMTLPVSLVPVSLVAGSVFIVSQMLRRGFVFWLPFVETPWVFDPRDKWRSSEDLLHKIFLVHEPVHVDQWYELGRVGFLRKYLTKRGRMQMEAEAFARSAHWWFLNAYCPMTLYNGVAVRIHPVHRYGDSLHKKYHLYGVSTKQTQQAIASAYKDHYGIDPYRYTWSEKESCWKLGILPFAPEYLAANIGEIR